MAGEGRLPAGERNRLRVRYAKGRRLAWLGHLELSSTVQRCVRRAGLPFVVGNGYARRMRIQFSQALPTGAASREEYFDVLLSERMDEREALGRLRAATPDDLAPQAAAYVGASLPALEAWLDHASWDVVVGGAGGLSAGALLDAVLELRARGELRFMRGERERVVDVSATLVSAEAERTADGSVRLSLVTRTTPAGSLRPGVLVDGVARAFPDVLPSGYVLSVVRAAQWHDEAGVRVKAL